MTARRKNKMDKSSIERGKNFMKTIVKASLKALFSIGVRSQTNVDKFIVVFTDTVEDELNKLGLIPKPVVTEKLIEPPKTISEPTQTTSPPPAPTKDPDLQADIKVLGLYPFLTKNLRIANINTVEQLIAEMQKRPLTEIKGIKEKAQAKITEAIKNYMKK